MTENRELEELHSKIDHLTLLVEQLSAEVRRSKGNTTRQEEFEAGDSVKILNNYRGEQGTIVTVSRVFGNKVYFTINGRNSYRYFQNVERVNQA